MSPAQSEDSGLAADRGSTYASISLPRENTSSMGIVLAGKILYKKMALQKKTSFQYFLCILQIGLIYHIRLLYLL